MKAGGYAVSVQWGAGYHYFVYTGDSLDTAKLVTKQNKKWCLAYNKKGAKPKVHLWIRHDVIED